MEHPRHPRPDLALTRLYRRLGADGPFGDHRRAHGIGLEGYYWRLTGADWSVAAIAGVCTDARGTWAMVTLASSWGFERTAVAEEAWADPAGLGVRAGSLLRADAGGVDADLGPGARLTARWRAPRPWPRRAWGALGPAHSIPGLGQYWTPHLLGAAVSGSVSAGERSRSLDGCAAYAEKNWGAAFAGHWWWGQASFDGDTGVAFAGGRVHGVAPTAVVVWTGRGLVRLAPPFATTIASAGGGAWRVRARGPYSRVDVEGEAVGDGLRLPVPVPGSRRLEVRSSHHLAGRLQVTVRRGRRTWLREGSAVAALEDGRRGGVPRPADGGR